MATGVVKTIYNPKCVTNSVDKIRQGKWQEHREKIVAQI